MTGTALGAIMHISRGSLLHTPPSPASSSASFTFGGPHAHNPRHSNKRQRLMRPERHAVVVAAAVEQAPKPNKQGSRARNGNGGSNGASTQGIVGKIPEEAESEFADGSVIKVGRRRASVLLTWQPLASPGIAERAADICGLLSGANSQDPQLLNHCPHRPRQKHPCRSAAHQDWNGGGQGHAGRHTEPPNCAQPVC